MFEGQPIKKSDVNRALKKIALLNRRNQIRSVTLENDEECGGPITQRITFDILIVNTTDDLRL